MKNVVKFDFSEFVARILILRETKLIFCCHLYYLHTVNHYVRSWIEKSVQWTHIYKRLNKPIQAHISQCNILQSNNNITNNVQIQIRDGRMKEGTFKMNMNIHQQNLCYCMLYAIHVTLYSQNIETLKNPLLWVACSKYSFML